MPIVHNVLADDDRKKLKRVWNMWHEFNIFKEDSWKEMGQCFTAPQVATRAVCTSFSCSVCCYPSHPHVSVSFLSYMFYRRMGHYSCHHVYEKKCKTFWMTCKAQ
jgi:hypothetical protein